MTGPRARLVHAAGRRVRRAARAHPGLPGLRAALHRRRPVHRPGLDAPGHLVGVPRGARGAVGRLGRHRAAAPAARPGRGALRRLLRPVDDRADVRRVRRRLRAVGPQRLAGVGHLRGLRLRPPARSGPRGVVPEGDRGRGDRRAGPQPGGHRRGDARSWPRGDSPARAGPAWRSASAATVLAVGPASGRAALARRPGRRRGRARPRVRRHAAGRPGRVPAPARRPRRAARGAGAGVPRLRRVLRPARRRHRRLAHHRPAAGRAHGGRPGGRLRAGAAAAAAPARARRGGRRTAGRRRGCGAGAGRVRRGRGRVRRAAGRHRGRRDRPPAPHPRRGAGHRDVGERAAERAGRDRALHVRRGGLGRRLDAGADHGARAAGRGPRRWPPPGPTRRPGGTATGSPGRS